VESLDDLVPAKAPEVTEPVATGEPVAAVEAAPVPEATARPAAVPAAVPADVEPVRPVIGKTQPAAPVPGAGGGSGAGAERGWLRFDGVGFQPAARDLELRAVFGRSEPFTRQLAMELTAAMPGVRGCVLFAADSLEVLASAWPGEAEARALAERTPKMFGRIEGLAEDLGLESGETFTLRTSQGIVSFFRSGGRCLSVLHADAPMEGGVWERLVLVARGAAALES
jgi:predicted regulator of Ras-like GTPase activity (Roadblock/LC7/MglB family)